MIVKKAGSLYQFSSLSSACVENKEKLEMEIYNNGNIAGQIDLPKTAACKPWVDTTLLKGF